ncbi:hypothetical protein ABC502_13000, partial [Alkalimonas sp. NCh-2]|uniref:hypothetical protein n=1 Tax=Alkalimonas sp. NCh-2 TaxID=3144846 RepID=UPI0031F62B97
TRILHRPIVKSSWFRNYFIVPLHFASLFESFKLISKRGRHFSDLSSAVKPILVNLSFMIIQLARSRAAAKIKAPVLQVFTEIIY